MEFTRCILREESRCDTVSVRRRHRRGGAVGRGPTAGHRGQPRVREGGASLRPARRAAGQVRHLRAAYRGRRQGCAQGLRH